MAWVMTVMVVALATTNPLYLAVLLLCVILVATVAPRTETGITSFRALATFGVSMLGVSVIIATINGNYGDHILFTIPGPDFPEWIGGLRLGGPVSAEGLVSAVIRGVSILCVFLAFGIFNGAVSPQRILRSTPGALFHASLVLTVGLTLLPSSVEDMRRVREMRALRGARGGFRDLPALVVPAVINGLERSMQLAEAMEARGYAASAQPPGIARLAAAASAPCLVFAAWLWFYTSNWQWLGVLLGAAGIACLGTWVAAAGRAHRRTTLRDEPVPLVQKALIAISVAVAFGVLAARFIGSGKFTYNPFAGLHAPEVSVFAVLAILATVWPVFILVVQPSRRIRGASEVGATPGTVT